MNIRYISLRTKIIASFLAVIILGGVLSLSFGSKLVEDTVISQAQEKVKNDQQTAWIIYNGKLQCLRQMLLLTARRERIQSAVKLADHEKIRQVLARLKEDNGLDALHLLDAEGRLVLRVGGRRAAQGDPVDDPLVAAALQGHAVSGTITMSAEELGNESKSLARRAKIEAVPTKKSSQDPEIPEGTGMMLMAAAPINSEGEGVVGVLRGGVLLNRGYDIVDKVKEAVYKDAKYHGADIGTATIFLSNLRISTNVMTENGKRAIGTLVSEEVNRAVLKQGSSWIGRAFVVNDWYITSYEPIVNPEGAIIGMLYVGMLEKPYIDSKNRVMLTFTGIACLCVVLLLVILYFSTTKIVTPLRKMVEATEKISRGDLSQRVDVKSRDEIGYLAISFNRMTENLRSANEKLVEWSRDLEKKVEERTKELREMQHHMIQSEKLASLGKLAASIAHEINNPLGGVLLYAHLVLEEMGENDPNRPNVEKIIKETTRCKGIVKDLLEFARPKEPRKDLIDVKERLERAVDIVGNQAEFQNVTILRSYDPDLPHVVADADQIQQVFMNLIINACEAMDGKGDLTLKTYRDSMGKNVVARIEDTGCGVSKEDMDRLFEPFFTTKEVGKGTGLGLAVSYSIITRHHGSITVESERGKGTAFTVMLPLGETNG